MKRTFKRNYSDHIISLVNEELSQKIRVTDISKKLKVSRKFVYSIKNKEATKPRGRPKLYDENKLKEQCKKSIKKLNKYKTKATATKIHSNLTENVSLRSLQLFLNTNKEFKLRNFKKRVVLNDEQRKNREKIITGWFTENLNFRSIVFSDECRFSLDGPDNFLSWDLYNCSSDCERPKRIMDGGGIMIYGFIDYTGYLWIEKISKTMNSEVYLDLLKEKVIPNLRERLGKNFILQQDNARPHIAKKVMQFFVEKKITILKWPSKSPDLSIIENVWHIMKKDVYDNYTIKNLDDLWCKIKFSQYKINSQNENIIKSMYNSMIKRYLSVLKYEGSNSLSRS